LKVQERRITTPPLRVSTFFAALPCVALLVLIGCGGGGQDSAQGEREEASTTGSTVVENTGGRAETTAETTGGTKTVSEATEPAKPYTAIVVSGAQPRSTPTQEVLVDGAEDTSDGPLKENRLVTYYGNPRSAAMGVLGEFADPEAMMERLIQQTAAYSAADPERPAVPTIELIASTAQREPGPEGEYLGRLSAEEIEQYAQLAEENGALLLLDVQLGRSTLATEIETLRPFLKRPYVHLAIDTEYYVAEGQVPGVDLGGVDGTEILQAVETLTQLVEEEGIPDKVVVVHQFESGIVRRKELVQPTSNVEVVLNADGFGAPENKISKYDILVSGEPIQYGGFKLFYTQDIGVLSPEQVLQLDPAPVVVNYQ
jgi:hypothetical protein